MALRGVKVIELAGLAPAPLCGMMLSDFGAQVVRVDKPKLGFNQDTLARGKRSVVLNLKKPEGSQALLKLCKKADVLIEPFRPGVMESLGLGPSVLCDVNPRLIYARLTGYGQTGPYSKMAGHDINYVAVSGVLSAIGRHPEPPQPPINLLGDFAGGALSCAFGITSALYERSQSNMGQVIDANMVEGAAYLSSFLWKTQNAKAMGMDIWSKPRGHNLLDGGPHFYETYRTKDDLFMSVGALEPHFYQALIKGLGLSNEEASQAGDAAQLKATFSAIFRTKTQKEWCEVFDGTDACVTPVVPLQEAQTHLHNKSKGSFVRSTSSGNDGNEILYEPRPAPRLSRSLWNGDQPGKESSSLAQPQVGEHTMEVLLEYGFSQGEINTLLKSGIAEQSSSASKL